MHAYATTPSPLQMLPDEVLTTVSASLLGPLNEMYTLYGFARAVASQTNHHFHVVMQRLWPVS